jgi:hypothetical protein
MKNRCFNLKNRYFTGLRDPARPVQEEGAALTHHTIAAAASIGVAA